MHTHRVTALLSGEHAWSYCQGERTPVESDTAKPICHPRRHGVIKMAWVFKDVLNGLSETA